MYVVLFLLLLLSAFFSASETALSSVNQLRLRARAENGDKKARGVLRQLDDYDGMLSAILIGNNVVNLSASSLATLLVSALLGPVYGPIVATVLLTLLVLIFGEIMPKSFAKENAEKVSIAVSAPLQILRVLLSPFVWMFVQMRKPFRRSEENMPSVTEDELKTFIDTVEEEGVLSPQETDIIQSAIEFDNITVQEILVPRVDIVAVNADAPAEEILRTCLTSNHSRLPVYEKGSLDHIIGMLHSRDLLECLAKKEPVDARRLCREVPFVYWQKHINALLAEFRHSSQQMAIVTDEYGGTLGLVTMEDILEELVGEIFDETDKVETPFRRLAEGLYRVDADLNVDDLFDALEMPRPDHAGDFSSAGGWALDCLEHIPAVGESFDYENLHVTVEKVEGRRIGLLRIRVLPKKEEEE